MSAKIDPQLVAQKENESRSEAMLLSYLMTANLDGIKQLLSAVNAPFLNFNQYLYFLSFHNDAECIKYIIPLSDPTHNHSEALRTAVQYGNPTTVALLLPVSALNDCRDVLYEIVEQTIDNCNEEWLKAVAECLNVAPQRASQALQMALENDCATVAHVLYPYVAVENLLQILEHNKTIQSSAHQDIRARFKLEAIKRNHESCATNPTKKL